MDTEVTVCYDGGEWQGPDDQVLNGTKGITIHLDPNNAILIPHHSVRWIRTSQKLTVVSEKEES